MTIVPLITIDVPLLRVQRAPKAFAVLAAVLLTGCSAFRLPETLGEKESGFGYVPVDPLAVVSIPGFECNEPPTYLPVLESLPDQTTRTAIASFEASGQISLGPSQLGTSGKTYQVVLDYINADSTNVPFAIGFRAPATNEVRSLYTVDELPPDAELVVERIAGDATDHEGDMVVIPVYVGLGLRLTSNLTVIRGNVNLASLGSIAAAAQAGRARGSLVVQSLGLSGRQVATSLPLPSELNETTVQNAILALASIKAIIYDEATWKTVRVTGIYNPIGIGGQRLINAIVSELAKEPIKWAQPCMNPRRS